MFSVLELTVLFRFFFFCHARLQVTNPQIHSPRQSKVIEQTGGKESVWLNRTPISSALVSLSCLIKSSPRSPLFPQSPNAPSHFFSFLLRGKTNKHTNQSLIFSPQQYKHSDKSGDGFCQTHLQTLFSVSALSSTRFALLLSSFCNDSLAFPRSRWPRRMTGPAACQS